MKICDFKLNENSEITNVSCEMFTTQNFVKKDGRVEQVGDNSFNFITSDNVVKFKISNKTVAKQVMDLFASHYTCLATVTNSNANTSGDNTVRVFFLHMGFFFDEQQFGTIPIVISDDVKEKIEKKYARKRPINDVLKENFELTNGAMECIAYTGSFVYDFDEENLDNTVDNEGEVEKIVEQNEPSEDELLIQEKEKLQKVKEKESKKKNALAIYGQDFAMYATIEGVGYDEKLFVSKISEIKKKIPMMKIAIAKLDFTSKKALLSKKIKESLENTKGYLDLWSQYANQEGKLLFEKVRRIGCISLDYGSISLGDDGKGIFIAYKNLGRDQLNLIQEGDYLFFSEDKPQYLADFDLTWEEYRLLSKGRSLVRGILVKILKKKNKGFVLDITHSSELPTGKYVSYSIKGDEEQILRRENARKRIMEGLSANPALGLILEGKLTENYDSSAIKKINPLSSFVKNKIFAHDPTETQKRAIDIALNTPDIAIIQGPPGTGKTTVITAIIERLNEICDKSNPVSGQVLITSFQHDAVRNVIQRLRVNSLPTLKFGKQTSLDEEDISSEELLAEWCEEYSNRLESKNPEVLETELRAEFEKYHNAYFIYPSEVNALKFLRIAKQINKNNELNKIINGLMETKGLGQGESVDEFLKMIRRLRTTKAGFSDDGALVADDILYYLERNGINKDIEENKKIYEVLSDAADCFDDEIDDDLLVQLDYVKRLLLRKCTPRPAYKKEVVDERIEYIYDQLHNSIKENQDEVSAILAELLQELRCNRSGVEKSLEHYLFVYSATTGQSEGKDIKRAKGIAAHSDEDEHPEYETVIVDEAARVSPPDLMIPLSQAKRRIILVGDHRQLPHMYDEEVFESLKESGQELDMGNVQKSMFQYLLEKAHELEKRDHIQRTIVLDSQYRMHPKLGEFVNKTFYEPHNERFNSPLPADVFCQNISKRDGIPFEWYNFPDDEGKEERMPSGSRIRECEADFIVGKIQDYIDANEEEKLTYGVISFYSDQVRIIRKKLKERLKEKAEKVQVGSVDAFQGMEFDVIFLSIVRSRSKAPISIIDREEKVIDYDLLELGFKEEDTEKDIESRWKEYLASDKVNYNMLETLGLNANLSGFEIYKKWSEYKQLVGLQNFGFLISENRLCVSLSRQKRMLIAVGNSEIFVGEKWKRLAEICVPGMKRLYEMCEEEGVIFDGSTESI